METRKPFWKTRWFWILCVLFIVVNLWINRNQQDAPNPSLPSQEDRVGTH